MRKLCLIHLVAAVSLVAFAVESAQALDGTFTSAGGSWVTAGNWSASTIADGTDYTANFATLDLLADATITLDGLRTIGHLIFGDTSPSHNWFLNTGSGGPLTLNVTSGTPTITVNNQTTTINLDLAGTQGFLKSGLGTLTLSASNTGLSGDITISQGTIVIRNNNSLGTSGTVTLGDGSTGANETALLLDGTISGWNFARPIVVSASGSGTVTIGSTSGTTANNLFGGTLQLNRGVTIQAGTTDRTTIAGQITGTGDITITSPFAANRRIVFDRPSGAANDFVGDVYLDTNARLQLGVANSIGNRTLPDASSVYFATGSDLRIAPTGSGDGETMGALISTTSNAGTVDMFTGSSFTLTIGGGDTSGDFSGIIKNSAGALSLTKTGAGTQILSGNNTYTGVTRLNGGVIEVPTLTGGTAAGPLGAAPGYNYNILFGGGTLRYTGGNTTWMRAFSLNAGGGTIDVSTAATVLTLSPNFNSPGNDVIIGTGGLTKAGPGTLVLAANSSNGNNNTYSGGTIVNDGTLQINTALALGSGSVTVNTGGNLNLQGNDPANAITLSGGLLRLSGNYSSTLTLDNVAGNTIYANGNYRTFSGQLTGPGGFTLTGTGTPGMILNNPANDFAGNVTINGGTYLRLTASEVLPDTTIVTDNGNLRFDVTSGTETIAGLSGSGTVWQPNTVTTGSFTFNVGAGNTSSSFSGSIGTGGQYNNIRLVKIGTGVLTLSGASVYTGGTTLNSGTLVVANNSALGTGTLTLAGGTLVPDGTARTLANHIFVSGGTSTELRDNADLILNGNISGSGTLTINSTVSNSLWLGGDASGFSGVVSFNVNSGGVNFRFQNVATNWSNATFQLSGATSGREIIWNGTAGANFQMGALSGTGGLIGGGVGNAFTLEVGALNTDATYAGRITTPASGAISLKKVGTGTLTLSGGNSYTGGTTVSQGTIKFGNKNALGSFNTSVTAVTVADGGAIDFNGVVDATYGYTIAGTGVGGTGALVNTGGAIGLGNAQASNIKLSADATIGGTGDWALLASGYGATTLDLNGFRLTKAGANTITLCNTTINAGTISIAGGTIALHPTQGTVNGSAANFVLANTAGVGLNLNNKNLTIASLQGGGTTGGNVTLGSGILTVDQSIATTYGGIISGTGGQLVKSGTGTLTLSGVNTFAGAATITAGTVVDGVASTVAGAFGAFNASASKITVLSGATVDINGKAAAGTDFFYGLTIAGSGTSGQGALVNNGTNGDPGNRSTPNITLSADATIGGTGDIYMINGGHAPDTLDLAGFTLTKDGSNRFFLDNTTVNAGTISIVGGTLSQINGSAANAANITLANAATAALDLNNLNMTIASLSGGGTTGGNVSLGSGNLTVNQSSTTTYGGVISGTGSLTKLGTGMLTLNHAGGNGGVLSAVEISGGTLKFDATGMGFNAGYFGDNQDITIDSGGTLEVARAYNLRSNNDMLIKGGALLMSYSTDENYENLITFDTAAGTITGSGGIRGGYFFNPTYTVTAAASGSTIDTPLTMVDQGAVTATWTFNVDDGAATDDLTINGQIRDLGGYAGLSLVKTGSGTQVVTGNNTYAGGTVINDGVLLVNNTAGSGTGSGAVTVNSGATLGGTGTISGAVTLNSGAHIGPGSSVGTITVGSLNLTAGSVLDFELNASPANDNIFVTTSGGLTINGGGFNLYNEGTTTAFTGTGSFNLINYSGTIVGYGVGALSVLNPTSGNSYGFSLNGNWVALNVGAERTWNGGGGTVSWNVGGNWVGGNAPAPGDSVIFGTSSPTSVSNNNDLGPNTQLAGITFANDGVYTLTGDAINLTGNVVNNTLNNQTINLELVLDGSSRTFDTASGDLTIGGTISQANGTWGLVKSGPNTLILTGDTTYGGNTTISSGTFQIGAGGASGSVAGNITDNANLVFNRSDSYAHAGLISGSGSVTHSGTGTLTISSYGHSFSGPLTVDNGTVIFSPSIVGYGIYNGGAYTHTNVINAAGTLRLTGDWMGHYNVFEINDGILDSAPASADASGPREYINRIIMTGGTITSSNGKGFRVGYVTGNGIITINGSATGSVIEAPQLELVNNGGQSVTFDVADGAAGDDLTVTSRLYDFGGLGGMTVIKDGAGQMVLNNSAVNNYAGTTIVNAGTLQLGPTGPVNGVIPSALTINSGGTVLLAQDSPMDNDVVLTVNSGGTLDMNGYVDIIRTLNGGGSVINLNASGDSGVVPSGATGTFSGSISGTGTGYAPAGGVLLREYGAGTQVFTGTMNFPNAAIAVSANTGIGIRFAGSASASVQGVILGAAPWGGNGGIEVTDNAALTVGSTGIVNGGGTTQLLLGGGTGNATLTANGTWATSVPITLTDGSGGRPTISVTGGNTMTIPTNIAGTGGLIKDGPGLLSLTATASSFAGNVDVNAGTLSLNAGGVGFPGLGSSGQFTTGRTFTVNSGATLRLENNWVWGSNGNTAVVNGGTLQFLNSDNYANRIDLTGGNITASGGTRPWRTGNWSSGSITVNASATSSTIAGSLYFVGTGAAPVTTFDVANGAAPIDLVLSSYIFDHPGFEGQMRLIKTGPGTLQLTNTGNSWDGGLSINGGVVSISQLTGGNTNGQLGGWLGTSAYFSFNGGTLEYTGASVGGINRAFTVNAGGAVLDITQAGTTVTWTDAAGAGPIIGTGALTKTGPGTLRLDGQTTLPSIVVEGGTLLFMTGFDQRDALGANGILTINAGGVAQLGDGTAGAGVNNFSDDRQFNIQGGILDVRDRTNIGTITMSGGTITGSAGTGVAGRLWLRAPGFVINADPNTATVENGNLMLLANTSFNVADGSASTDLLVNSVIQENSPGFGFTKTGAGTMVVTAANTYSGNTTLNGGTLKVENAIGSGTGTGLVIVNNNATLAGNGSIGGTVTVNSGGHFAPGSSVGTLTMSGLSLGAGSLLDYEFTALVNDQAIVTATDGLVINGGGFNLYNEDTVTPWTQSGEYDLIQYVGTIGGAGIGAMTINNQQPGVSYGIVLSNNWVRLIMDGQQIWDGASAADSNWTTGGGGGNWSGGTVLANGGLTFLGPDRLINTNDFPVNTRFAGMIFDASAGAFQLEGNDVNLIGNIVNNSTSTQTINLPLVLDAGSRAFNTAAGDIVVNSQISETGGSWGVVKTGAGTLYLNAANTHTGGTWINDGTLSVNADDKLGASGGTLGFGGGAFRPTTSMTLDDRTVALTGGIGTMSVPAGLTLTVTNSVIGAGGLAKTDTGTLVFTGANLDYTGTTTINAGTMLLSNATAFASSSIANNSKLLVVLDSANALTVGGGITGTGSLTKTGTGTLSLNGAGNYNGGTTLAQGTIRVGVNGALGTGPVTLGDASTGASDVALLMTYGNFSIGPLANDITVAALGSGTATIGTIDFAPGGAFASRFGGTITMNRPTTLQAGNTDRTAFEGKLTGPVGTLTIAPAPGANNRRINIDNNANDFVGAIVVASGARLQFNGSGTVIPDATDVTINSNATVTFNSASETINGLFGSGVVEAITGGNKTLTVGGGNGGGTFSGVIQNGAGVLHVAKTGTGTQVLGGNNTYTGTTTVNNGTLVFTGNNAYTGATTINGGVLELAGSGELDGTSTVTIKTGGTVSLIDSGRINLPATVVMDGGTLRQNSSNVRAGTITFTGSGGTITGMGVIDTSAYGGLNISSGVFLAPGNSPGAQNFLGLMNWSDGGTYVWEINDWHGTASNNWDFIALDGDLEFTGLSAGGFTIEVVGLTLGNTPGLPANFARGDSQRFPILNSPVLGIDTAFDPGFFTISAAGFPTGSYISWTVESDGNTLWLQYTAMIPEPTTAVLLGLGGLLLLVGRRVRRSARR